MFYLKKTPVTRSCHEASKKTCLPLGLFPRNFLPRIYMGKSSVMRTFIHLGKVWQTSCSLKSCSYTFWIKNSFVGVTLLRRTFFALLGFAFLSVKSIFWAKLLTWNSTTNECFLIVPLNVSNHKTWRIHFLVISKLIVYGYIQLMLEIL